MLLSRLRRCFSSKPSSSPAYRRLYTPPRPIADTLCPRPNPSPPPSPLPIYDDDLNRPESLPTPPIPIGDGGSGIEEKTSAMYRIENEEEVATDCSFGPVAADISGNREKTSAMYRIEKEEEVATDCSLGPVAADINGNEKKTSAMYRIENELRVMNDEAASHCSFGPVGGDIFRWEGVVIGPACSCYEGGIFHLSIQFPSDYPLYPPYIKFLTKIFHPNVGLDGSIYLDILNENWSSVLTIEKVLLSICSILSNPIPPTSINEASRMYLNNWLNFNEIAREWTKIYAMPN